MTRPARRLRRFLLRSLALVVLLAVVGWATARLLLSTDAARRLVAADLGQRLHTSASFDELDASLYKYSVVHGLTLSDDHGEPYLTSERVEVSLSLWKALRGARLPGLTDARNATLRLRFDKAGNLLTKLPSLPRTGRTPILKVRGLTVILDQEGRPPFTLEGGALLQASDRPNNLRGVLDDPVWGALDVEGHFGDGKFFLELTSPGVALTAGMFRSLPFVPESLHRQLEFEGERVPLRLRLWIGPKAPYTRYEVTFGRAQVTLLQSDRAPLVVSGASGTLEGSEEGFLLKGHIDDPYWGKWQVASGYVSRTGSTRVHLATRDTDADPRKLEALPYVPAKVWRTVQVTGRTSAAVSVEMAGDKHEVQYRVDLSPRKARVHIAPLDLEAADASGQVVVENHRVFLRDVRGKSASGSIATRADMDFRSAPTRMSFDLDVRGLVLGELPSKWELPRQVEGKVTGKAKLDVTVQDGRTETRGQGTGRIDEAKLVGFRTGEAIPLELLADGKTIRFRPRWTLLHSLMSGPASSGAQGVVGRGESP